MRWSSALSTTSSLPQALDELKTTLALDAAPDLLIVFVSAHFREDYERIPSLIRELFAPRVLYGCSAAGVIGGGQEVEREPAISVTAAVLPNVELQSFHLETNDLPTPDDSPGAWRELLGVPNDPLPQFLLLSDPGSCDPTRLLEGLDYAYPASTKVGGLASDGVTNALFSLENTHASGTLGLAFSGEVVLDAIVAQGCKPIGQQHVITRCHHNMLLELDRRKPTEVLAELYQTLDERDQSLLHHALHLGVASSGLMTDTRQEYLIRNVMGADPRRGMLAIGALLRPGQTVQFHLRDSEAAEAELKQILTDYRSRRDGAPAGAVLFSCTGRGEHLFGHSNHDSDAFAGQLGQIPLGGFFCAGEIGPVGTNTHLLGYTSSFGVFRSQT